MKNFIPYLILPTLVALTARCGGSEDGDASGGAGGTAGSGGSSGSGGDASATGGSAGVAAGGTSGTAGASGGSGAGGSGGSADGGQGDPCSAFGAIRQLACGLCGKQEQTCASDGFWSNVGSCTGEGECQPSAQETRSNGTCSEEKRTCDTACSWSGWTATNADPCNPGDVSYENTGCTPGLLIKKTCGVNCVWTAAACGNHCTGTARTTPPEAEEVCVPAGDFIRGDADFVDSSPVKNVYLSEYYIDRFPVTNKRYRACETAGVCGAPSEDIGYTSTLRDDYPVQSVSKANAIAFCQWDGGRKLASEAQWEKAARGPAPNWTKYIWGDQPDCATSPGPCPTPVAMSAYPVPFKYNELPAMRGFYGAEYLGHSTRELVLDGYYSGFYNDPQSLSDPVYNPNSPTFVTRGYYAHATPHPIGRREQVSLQILAGIHAVFRCTLAP